MPHYGGVARVDLDILHFLFLSIMIIIEYGWIIIYMNCHLILNF